jgi:hypothetical protein
LWGKIKRRSRGSPSWRWGAGRAAGVWSSGGTEFGIEKNGTAVAVAGRPSRLFSKTRKSQEKWKRSVIEFTNDAILINSHEYGSINKNTAHLWRMRKMAFLGKLMAERALSGTVWIEKIRFYVAGKSKIAGTDRSCLRGLHKA